MPAICSSRYCGRTNGKCEGCDAADAFPMPEAVAYRIRESGASDLIPWSYTERHQSTVGRQGVDVEHLYTADQLRAARLDGARAAVDAMGVDTARLDFISKRARCDPKMDGQHVWWPTTFSHALRGPTLREAIDAAMAKEQQ